MVTRTSPNLDTQGHLLDPETDDLGAAVEPHFDGPMGVDP
jgi:hypothetical protein